MTVFQIPRRPRLRSRAARCYELAGHLALDHPEWVLVQGEVDMHDGSRMGHAWNEREGWVYDSVLDEAVLAPEFTARFSATEAARWQGRAVAAMVLTHQHWGPWT